MRFSQNFKLESLLFVAFFATLPLYSPNLVMFHEFGLAETCMPAFVNALMIGSIVAGLCAAWIAVRRGDMPFSRASVVLTGSVCYVVGYGMFAACLGLPEFGSTLLAAVAGILVAVGCVVLCIAWGMYLAMLGLRQALFSLALMVGMASLVGLMLSSVNSSIGLVVFGLLLVLGVALPCWKALVGGFECAVTIAARGEVLPYGDGFGGPEPEFEVRAPRRALLANVRQMASVLAMPFIGLLVFAFVMGVRKFIVFDLFYIEALGGIASAVVVLPLCLVRIEKPLLSFLYQVFLPACALILVLLNSFPVGSLWQWLAAALSYVFFGVIGILALASLCAMAHAREFPAALIYGLTVASFMVVSFLGIFCGTLPWFSSDAGPILLVLCTAYFVFLVFAPLVSAWRHSGADVDASTSAVVSNDVQTRCEQAAKVHALSPRETEILSYLGRGHGIAYVAKTLVISESTVRTHVKSIYKKLGVSSREELLQLIDGE